MADLKRKISFDEHTVQKRAKVHVDAQQSSTEVVITAPIQSSCGVTRKGRLRKAHRRQEKKAEKARAKAALPETTPSEAASRHGNDSLAASSLKDAIIQDLEPRSERQCQPNLSKLTRTNLMVPPAKQWRLPDDRSSEVEYDLKSTSPPGGEVRGEEALATDLESPQKKYITKTKPSSRESIQHTDVKHRTVELSRLETPNPVMGRSITFRAKATAIPTQGGTINTQAEARKLLEDLEDDDDDSSAKDRSDIVSDESHDIGSATVQDAPFKSGDETTPESIPTERKVDLPSTAAAPVRERLYGDVVYDSADDEYNAPVVDESNSEETHCKMDELEEIDISQVQDAEMDSKTTATETTDSKTKDAKNEVSQPSIDAHSARRRAAMRDILLADHAHQSGDHTRYSSQCPAAPNTSDQLSVFTAEQTESQLFETITLISEEVLGPVCSPTINSDGCLKQERQCLASETLETVSIAKSKPLSGESDIWIEHSTRQTSPTVLIRDPAWQSSPRDHFTNGLDNPLVIDSSMSTQDLVSSGAIQSSELSSPSPLSELSECPSPPPSIISTDYVASATSSPTKRRMTEVTSTYVLSSAKRSSIQSQDNTSPRGSLSAPEVVGDEFVPPGVRGPLLTPIKNRSLRRAGVSNHKFPPISAPAFGLVQEKLWREPFWLLIAVTFLNKTAGKVAAPIFWELKRQYPTAHDLARADERDLIDLVYDLGLQTQRSRRLIKIARAWVAQAPVKGLRYRASHSPTYSDGRDLQDGQTVEGDADDCAGALEIGHIPGCDPYAWDSWRIFCRDKLRGVAGDYMGGDTSEEFQPEWQRVLPHDKELRACLRWMWLREGYVWNHETGVKRKLTEAEWALAKQGELEPVDEGEAHFTAQAREASSELG